MRLNAVVTLSLGPVNASTCRARLLRRSTVPWLKDRQLRCGNSRPLRYLSTEAIDSSSCAVSRAAVVQNYKKIFCLPHLDEQGKEHLERRREHDEQVVVSGYGYIVNQRSISKNLLFATLLDQNPDRQIQLVSSPKKGYRVAEEQHALLKSLNRWTPVYYEGLLQRKREPGSKTRPDETSSHSKTDRLPASVSERTMLAPGENADLPMEAAESLPRWLKEYHQARGLAWSSVRSSSADQLKTLEIKLDKLTVLNDYPSDLHFGEDHVVPPHLRHLQIKNDRKLRHALQFRAQVAQSCRHVLKHEKFLEVETPLLFKSTPEGAREFIVPTREKGRAYALPQSPQQYKQILMASGIPRYYQFAKCFRDEDLRADRQPEFTQLDFEMAFATGWHVREVVAKLIKHVWAERLGVKYMPSMRPTVIAYEDAMARYGSDKPDTRLGMELMRIEHFTPQSLTSKIGPIAEPIVEALKLELDVDQPREAQSFIGKFMDSPEAAPFVKNAHGQPGIFIYDPQKPLGGLFPFGFEAAERIETEMCLEPGNVVVIQARPNEPFSGGSTPIGNLRLALARAAAAEGLLAIPEEWSWLWVTDFPLFTKASIEDATSSEQHMAFTPTHHPFTAPATERDIDLLLTDPLAAKADHYDLVLNGVELGGGSRRIHSAEFQKFILRDILKLDEHQMKNFDHLIEVLRAGCPPHAGFAMGFDRLVKEMLRVNSLRDVIAFPKSGSGEDMLVKSPGTLTADQLDTYHLRLN